MTPNAWLPIALQKLIFACLVTASISVVLGLLSLGRPRAANGWVVLRPTLLLYGVGVVSIPMAAFFLVYGAIGIFGSAIQEWGPHPRIFAGGMVTMGLMFPYCALTTFCVQVRFNEAGVEKSWFGRPTFIPWTEIRKLKRSFFKGPILVDASGRGVQISEYLAGFLDLAATANAKGVLIADEFRQ